MRSSDEYQIDKPCLRRSFNRAALHYDDSAALQRQVANDLLERLDYIRIKPGRILDAGTGTGYCARVLAKKYRKSCIIGLDQATSMLSQARRSSPRFLSPHRYIGGDLASLPLADNSVDLVVSSLTMQWCPNLSEVFSELRRVLKPGGLLMFSSFGPDTLQELRHAWSVVDDHVHVNHFVDMHAVGDMMMQAGFRDVVMDADRIVLEAKDVISIMRNLKAIGAHNVHKTRFRGLTGKSSLLRLKQEYDTFRTSQGMLPVTYEAVYAHAWAPEEPGHVAIPFSDRVKNV